MKPVRIVGMAWYRPEDYDRLKKMFTDGHNSPDSYQQWRELAENGLHDLERKGYLVVKAYIDPDTFPEWCRARGLNLDAKARTEFSTWFAGRRHGSQN